MSWRGWAVLECPIEAEQYLNVQESLGSPEYSDEVGYVVLNVLHGEAGQYLNVLERLGSTWAS
jgi:hypothetical protein